MSAVAETLRAEMEAIFQRLQPGQAEPEPFDFARDEPWNATLEKLPRTCRLWRTFLEYDTARRGLDALEAQRRAWDRELSTINERMSIFDPDALTQEVFDTLHLKGRRLEHLHKQSAHTYEGLKQATAQHQERWGTMWDGYLAMLAEERRQERQAGNDWMSGQLAPRNTYLEELRANLRRLEGARN